MAWNREAREQLERSNGVEIMPRSKDRKPRLSKIAAHKFGTQWKGRGYTASYSGLTTVDLLTLETPERFDTRAEAIAAVQALADFHGMDASTARIER